MILGGNVVVVNTILVINLDNEAPIDPEVP